LNGEGTLTDPLILSLKLEEKALGSKDGNKYLVGDPGQYLFKSEMFDADGRIYDLLLGERKTITTSYKIKLPNNFFITKLPATMDVNNRFFSLKRNVNYTPAVGEMEFSEAFVQKVDKVKRRDYKKIKNAYDSLIENDLGQDWVVEVR